MARQKGIIKLKGTIGDIPKSFALEFCRWQKGEQIESSDD